MKIDKTGIQNPAKSSPMKGGRMLKPISNPASADRDGMTNHKILKATSAAPMTFDGAPLSFDSGGKKPGNTC